jgi:hypothetical protein
MPTGKQTYKESDGKSLDVALVSNYVQKNQVIWAESWVGVTNESGDSGDTVSLDIAQIERQFTVPSTLSVSKGDIVYLIVANRTGNVFADNAYTTSIGAGRIAFFKATADKDANHVVTGIMLGQLAYAS